MEDKIIDTNLKCSTRIEGCQTDVSCVTSYLKLQILKPTGVVLKHLYILQHPTGKCQQALYQKADLQNLHNVQILFVWCHVYLLWGYGVQGMMS